MSGAVAETTRHRAPLPRTTEARPGVQAQGSRPEGQAQGSKPQRAKPRGPGPGVQAPGVQAQGSRPRGPGPGAQAHAPVLRGGPVVVAAAGRRVQLRRDADRLHVLIGTPGAAGAPELQARAGGRAGGRGWARVVFWGGGAKGGRGGGTPAADGPLRTNLHPAQGVAPSPGQGQGDTAVQRSLTCRRTQRAGTPGLPSSGTARRPLDCRSVLLPTPLPVLLMPEARLPGSVRLMSPVCLQRWRERARVSRQAVAAAAAVADVAAVAAVAVADASTVAEAAAAAAISRGAGEVQHVHPLVDAAGGTQQAGGGVR
jgi:hypothetical protein